MLKMYVGYSANFGEEAGVCLIFAHSARKAKKLGWDEADGIITDKYIDFKVYRLRDKKWLYEEADQHKLVNDIPHVVFVESCKSCGMWGVSEINEDGLCVVCGDARKLSSQYPLY